MTSNRINSWIKIVGNCRKEHNFFVVDQGLANCVFTGDLCDDRNCPKMGAEHIDRLGGF